MHARTHPYVHTKPTPPAPAELNADPVVPAAFPQWSDVLNGWGNKLLGAVSWHDAATRALYGAGEASRETLLGRLCAA